MYIRGLVVVALLVSLCRATVWLHEDFEQWPAAHGSPWRLVESRSKAAAFFQQQRIERFSNDTGSLLSNSMLVAPSKAKFYGAYRMLERSVPFIASEPLVLQFDAFLPEELNCAGGYIKLVSAANVSHWDYEVPKQSRWWPKRVPFAVLFGPDMCGKSIKHVRLVLQVYRPDLRIWEEWHLLRAPSLEQVPRGVTSRFYLSVTTDYSFEIRVNYNSVYNGTLNNEHFVLQKEIAIGAGSKLSTTPLDQQPERTFDPSLLQRVTGVMFDIWTMHADLRFDNVLLASSEDELAPFTSRPQLRQWIRAELQHNAAQRQQLAETLASVRFQVLEFMRHHWVLLLTLSLASIITLLCLTWSDEHAATKID